MYVCMYLALMYETAELIVLLKNVERNERDLPFRHQGAIYNLTEIFPVFKQLGKNDFQPKYLAWQDNTMLIDAFITTFILS